MKQTGTKLEMSVEELREMLNRGELPVGDSKIIHIHIKRDKSAIRSGMSYVLAGFTLGFATGTAAALIEHSWGIMTLSLFLAVLFFIGYRMESRNGE